MWLHVAVRVQCTVYSAKQRPSLADYLIMHYVISIPNIFCNARGAGDNKTIYGRESASNFHHDGINGRLQVCVVCASAMM